MPFTISPAEAQAIQEDEVQLLNAISQVAQRVPGVFRIGSNDSNGQQPTDAFRIKMGRRLVYGKLADGPFRHELDVNSLKVITDALQQPVTPGVNPDEYTNKVPAIEISHGGVVLFREERDGTVTTNEIQIEVAAANQQNPNQPIEASPESETVSIAESAVKAISVDAKTLTEKPAVSLADNSVDVVRANQLLITAQYLLNPLRQTEGIYDEVSIQGYQIRKRGADILIENGDQVVLHAHNGELIGSKVNDLDWYVLGNIQVPERFPQPVLNDVSKPVLNEAVKLQETEDSLSQSLENTVVALDHPALSILERETQNLPIGHVRQLLQAAVQDWKQQVSQQISHRVQQGASWLANQHQALQNQRLAYAVHQLFQRGHERTGEQSYHVRDCTITRRGQNLYVLKDAVGELMQLKTSKIMGLGRRMTVLSVSDRITPHQRQNLINNQLDASVMPQGSLDVEAAYATKTQKVETTVRQFLTDFAHAHTWNRENGHFKLEMGEGDALRITDKQNGRGIVFERKDGEVSSKLGGQDFSHFERLSDKMKNMVARQTQTIANSVQPASNGHKKTSSIEMD